MDRMVATPEGENKSVNNAVLDHEDDGNASSSESKDVNEEILDDADDDNGSWRATDDESDNDSDDDDSDSSNGGDFSNLTGDQTIYFYGLDSIKTVVHLNLDIESESSESGDSGSSSGSEDSSILLKSEVMNFMTLARKLKDNKSSPFFL